jgi:Golgi phosphoprotein 3 (GPP34)
MLIAERLLLIACDPATGEALWPREQPHPDIVTAGAVAAELVTHDRLALKNGLFVADLQIPTGHPLLKSALQSVQGERLDGLALLRAIANRMSPLRSRILEGLFRRDILHRVAKRDFLLRQKVRYPVRSMQARNEAIDALRTTAHTQNDMNGLALLFLTEAAGLLSIMLKAKEHEQAQKRILVLNDVTSHSSETLLGLAYIRAALLS